MTIDLSELTALRETVRRFGAAVKDEVAMAGAAAGARVLYIFARTTAPISDAVHTFYGRDSKRTGVTYTFTPGNLQRSVYRVFVPEKSSENFKFYKISWNHKKAPYGIMVELGTSHSAAHSFIGAALSEAPEAFRYAKIAMGEQLDEIKGRRL